MALYLGLTNNGTFISSDGYRLQDSNNYALYASQASNKWKIVLNNVTYHLNVKSNTKESE